MKRILLILMLVASFLPVRAQLSTDTLRPTTTTNITNGANTRDGNIATIGNISLYGAGYETGTPDPVVDNNYQTLAGTVTGFPSPLHTYNSVIVYYRCTAVEHNVSVGMTLTWSGGGPINLVCDGVTRPYGLPALADTSTISVNFTVRSYDEYASSSFPPYIGPDPGYSSIDINEAWVEAQWGTAPRKRGQVIATE